MTSPAVPPRSAKGWFWAAGIVSLVGLIAAVVLGVQAAGSLPDRPAPLDQGANNVRLDKDGLTLFTSELMTGAECTVTTAAGAPVAMEDPAGSERYEFDTGTWYVSRRSAEAVRGEVVITCPQADTSFAYGPRNTIVKFAVLVVSAIGAAVAGFGIAVVLLIVGFVKRGKYRREQAQRSPGITEGG